MTRVGALRGSSRLVLGAITGGVYRETVLPRGRKSARGEGGGMEVVIAMVPRLGNGKICIYSNKNYVQYSILR